MTSILVLGVLLVFAALFLVFSAVGGVSSERGGVGRSLDMLEAMSTAPKELAESEADRPFGERVLEPLYLKAQRTGRRLSGADSAERLRHKLDLAGNPPGWNVDRVAAGKVIGSFAGFAFSAMVVVVFGVSFPIWILVILGGTAAGFMAPNLYLYQRAYERTERMQRELPDAIDLLTISVESGLAFDAALQQVARKTEGPIGEEFARVLQEMQIGRSRAESMRSLADRTTMPDLRAFVSAMVQADSFGIPIGQVLRVQSHEIRTKRRQWAEEKAQKVPVKITVPLIFCILPCLFIAVLGPAAITIMNDLM